jgi:hypothetical protein
MHRPNIVVKHEKEEAPFAEHSPPNPKAVSVWSLAFASCNAGLGSRVTASTGFLLVGRREASRREKLSQDGLGAPQFRQGESSGARLPLREADGAAVRAGGAFGSPGEGREGGRRSQWARGARARAFRGRRDLTGERRMGGARPREPGRARSSPAAPVPSGCASSVLGRCACQGRNIPLIRRHS